MLTKVESRGEASLSSLAFNWQWGSPDTAVKKWSLPLRAVSCAVSGPLWVPEFCQALRQTTDTGI